MTNLKDKVTTLKTSQALKKAGFEVESEFYWVSWKGKNKFKVSHKDQEFYGVTDNDIDTNTEAYHAYLSDELLKALQKGKILIAWRKAVKEYSVDYKYHAEHNKSLPEALAEMVLWCIKEGHIKV